MDYLDHWEVLQTDHSAALSGATKALRASTLRLPVPGGAKADVLTVKNTVSSAVDIMQATGSLVCNLVTKVKHVINVLRDLGLYKEDIMREFAPQQDDGNVEQ